MAVGVGFGGSACFPVSPENNLRLWRAQYVWTFSPVGVAGGNVTAKSTAPSLASAAGALTPANTCELASQLLLFSA